MFKLHLDHYSVKRLAGYLFLCLLPVLTSCSFGPKSVDDVVSDAVRNQGVEAVPSEQEEKTAEYYIHLASQSSGETRQQHLITAAELLFKRGDIALAESQLKNIQPEDIESTRDMQIQLLAARIARANGNPEQALALLPADNQLTKTQLLEAYEIKAAANLDLGYMMDSIKARVTIDHLYTLPEEREQNHKAIWGALSALPSVKLNGAKSSDPTLQGWITLARIMRKAQLDPSNLQTQILDWGTQYPHHPVSNIFINQLIDDHLDQYATMPRIAVLLPMQGGLQGVGNAIKNGFLSAYYDDRKLTKPSIRFYDTSAENLDFNSLYKRIQNEGANYVVGPFNKNLVSQIAQANSNSIPVLTLNYTENAEETVDNMYQFGLLPEDEAVQVAEMAIRQEKKRAVILTPDSEWGRRLQTAFSTHYQQLGGTVLASQYYDPNTDYYAQPIKTLFNLDYSQIRYKNIQRLLGVDVKFTPYRRQDIDMIFMAATHRSARGIMPAFKFHHAGDIPVYSTSHVYTGNEDSKADFDLNGLIFCDLPWTLVNHNPFKKIFQSQWPEQQAYTRLFALGIDAYHIIRNINYLKDHDYARFSGQTGNIYLDDKNRLHRELIWAQFRRGVAEYIDTTVAPGRLPTHGNNES